MSKETIKHTSEPEAGAGTAEGVTVTIEVHRNGSPVETIKVECDAEPSDRHIAEKLASILALDAEELLEDIASEHDKHRHHATLKLVCLDIHFETESARHHFPSRAKWHHVHRWACRKFEVANDACPNLELRDGSAEGAPLNESEAIGPYEGCRTVWLVKPGPEKNGWY